MNAYYKLSDGETLARSIKTLVMDAPNYDFSTKEAEVVDFVTRMKNGEFIDAQVIQKALFPNIKKKFFISHSHQERGLALRVAQELGIGNCFIDSLFWSSADNTLTGIQRRLLDPKKKENTYSNLNELASHFYSMLSVAIQNAIAEASIFIYIPPSSSFAKSGKDYQYSPWIYQELSFARNMYNQGNQIIKEAATMSNFATAFAYCSDLSFLKPIAFKGLNSLK